MRLKWLLAVSYWLLVSELTPQPSLFLETHFEGGFSKKGK
jgi:hypothetical protein